MFLLWLSCPNVGIGPLASIPPLTKGRASPTNTPVFHPNSFTYWVLCGTMYSFPLVRYSCPFSAGVLHAHLCLKVYSWIICGEMHSMSIYSFAILFLFYNLTFWKYFCFIIREWNFINITPPIVVTITTIIIRVFKTA